MYINFWYPMATGEEVGEKPHRVRALGQDFVVFRDSQGHAQCLSNTCTHRGGALAGGKVHRRQRISARITAGNSTAKATCHKIPSLGKKRQDTGTCPR